MLSIPLDRDGEIQPARVDQIRAGAGGREIVIDADVGGVVKQLREIDPAFRVRYSEAGDYFVVYCQDEGGDPYMVATYQELDARVVSNIREIVYRNRQPGYSYAAELERMNADADRRREQRFSEQIGERAERLAHAVRKDLGDTSRAFIDRNPSH